MTPVTWMLDLWGILGPVTAGIGVVLIYIGITWLLRKS
jgi:hypothetical protein